MAEPRLRHSRGAAHGMITRSGRCSSSSPQRSTSSYRGADGRRRRGTAAGRAGGRSRSLISAEPCTCSRALTTKAGTVFPGTAARAGPLSRYRAGGRGRILWDALVLEHPLRRSSGIRCREACRARTFTARIVFVVGITCGGFRCCSPLTSATARPISAPSMASASSSTGAFRPRAGATGDELAERIAGMLRAERDRLGWHRRRLRSPRSCRRSAAEYEQLTERYIERPGSWRSGPG